jgi:predicted RNase H-like nuclease (RuvC/YqgF family)
VTVKLAQDQERVVEVPSDEPASEVSVDERRLRELEAQLLKLTTENNSLKQNQTASDTNVQTFVREMNQLLDLHDIGGAGEGGWRTHVLTGESGEENGFNRNRRPR